MSKQPEALRIAERCENLATIADAYSEEAYREAAAELRRLHSLNAELVDALKEAYSIGPRNFSDVYGSEFARKVRDFLSDAEAQQ